MEAQLAITPKTFLKNLSVQSQKRREVYLECCENQDEKSIVFSVFSDLSLKDISDAEGKINSLIDKVGMWRLYLGCMKDVTPKLIRIEAEYISSSWQDMTINECDLAFKLFLHQKLPIQYPNYINFSPLFISQVLTAYTAYKRDLYIKLNEKADKLIEEPIVVTPNDKVENMRDCIKMCYEQITGDVGYTLIASVVWDYLWRTKKIQLSEEIIEKAKEHAKNREFEEGQKKRSSGLYYDIKEYLSGEENRKRMFAREYCLKKFFEENDVADVIGSVCVEEVK